MVVTSMKFHSLAETLILPVLPEVAKIMINQETAKKKKSKKYLPRQIQSHVELMIFLATSKYNYF